jgi:ABC-type amino acid transport system permease subunit
MKSYELAQIDRLPYNYKPLTAWGYFWLTILYSIPVLGWIFLVIFAFSDANINRRSHARSYFCAIVLALLLATAAIVLSVLGVITLPFLS